MQNFLRLRARTDTASLCRFQLGKISHSVTSYSKGKVCKRTNTERFGLLGASNVITVTIIFNTDTTNPKGSCFFCSLHFYTFPILSFFSHLLFVPPLSPTQLFCIVTGHPFLQISQLSNPPCQLCCSDYLVSVFAA